jgi:hypothetical protein
MLNKVRRGIVKKFNKFLKTSIVLIFVFLMSAVISCSNQEPLSPVSATQDHSVPAPREIRFIQLGMENSSFNKIVSVSDWVTKLNGGELVLEYTWANKNPEVYCKNILKIIPGTISEDAELSLSIDDKDFFKGDFDVVFQPHGITFSAPALLNIEIKNADLSGFNPDDLEIFYVNSQTGQWEEINCEEIIVKPGTGYIKVVDAEISHFSRYAIGEEQ